MFFYQEMQQENRPNNIWIVYAGISDTKIIWFLLSLLIIPKAWLHFASLQIKWYKKRTNLSNDHKLSSGFLSFEQDSKYEITRSAALQPDAIDFPTESPPRWLPVVLVRAQ